MHHRPNNRSDVPTKSKISRLIVLLLSSTIITVTNVHSFTLASSTIPTFSNNNKLSSSSSLASTETSTSTPTPTTKKYEMKKSLLDELTNYANSYAAANGLQVETTTQKSSTSPTSASYQCAPISLLPNAFPHESFVAARNLAPHFNLLVEKVSTDGKFLCDALEGSTKDGDGGGGVTSRDGYTRNLLEMYRRIYMVDADEEYGRFARRCDKLGILRSDYMLNERNYGGEDDSKNGYELKQVELNTIASSFAGLSANVAGLHKMLTERFGGELEEWLQTNQKRVMGLNYTPPSSITPGVPHNPALTCLPEAMNVAHERYKSQFSPTVDPVVLFVVQEGETNTVDQRMLEFRLWENHRVRVVRMSLTAAYDRLRLDEDTGTLAVLPSSPDGPEREVSLVYFRAGYAPADYPDGDDGIEWKSRERIELSRATKCPNLGYHLAGTKKVQQELARPGVLEKFFGAGGGDVVGSTREAFAGLYALGEDAVKEDLDAAKDAISGGEGRYVLKPQREGGGYNYYGERLAAKLKENTKVVEGELELGRDLAEFILMQRLFPPQQEAVLLRGGRVEGVGESISEFGCFGTIVATCDGTPLHNEYSGFLLRTKFSNVDEGGVASGFATLSSPYLC